MEGQWMKSFKLEEIADVKLSNVDKITNPNERQVRLCNYTDVYKNWNITQDMTDSFMIASCNETEIEKFSLKKGQVAITKDSETPDDIGVSAYIADDFQNVVLGYHLALITPFKEKLNGLYLNYLLHTKHLQTYFENNAGGSGQRCSLPIDILKQIPVTIPNIQTQNLHAAILFALEKKIVINNQINDNLEAMAKTIYDYWFVQNAVIEELEYNNEIKRKIPKNWKVEKLGKVENNIITGKTPSTKVPDYFDGKIPFICIGDLRDNVFILSTELSLSKLGADSQKNKYIPKDAICVSCIATPGLVAFASETSQTNQQLNTIVCNDENKRYYLYFYLQDYFKYAKAKTGNTFANMNKEDFSAIPIIVPIPDVLNKFSILLTPIMNRILENGKENLHLTQLRNWLLPMLMNGQVSVNYHLSD